MVWWVGLMTVLLCSAAFAAPAVQLGLIVDGDLSPHQAAIRDWAEQHYSVTLICPDGEGGFFDKDGKAVALGDFSCLWYHCVMGHPRELSPWYCKLTTEGSLRAMADYLACGGGLYVTGSGARYLTRLGVEPYFAGMNYVAGGNNTDCGYEALDPKHPIFAGLGKTFMVQHMRKDENGACGFWKPEKLQSPLAYSYLCTQEQQERFLSGRPLARWAGLEEERFIIVEHQVGAGKVVTNGPYFYYFDDSDDPHRENLERLTDNILQYISHDGPVPVQRDTLAAKTLMRRSGVYWGLDLTDGDYAAIDIMDYYFDIHLLAPPNGYGTRPWRPSERLAKTIGVKAERGKGFIAGDIRYSPVVSMYAYPQCPSLFPCNSNCKVLEAWCKDYLLSGDAEALEGLRNCVEFVLWAQYDENGYNAFLDETGQMEFDGQQGDAAWAYGWPYMNFDWPDGFGYTWQAFESFHHTTPAFPLVKAYEITGDQRCLEAARNWLEHQLPRYGPNDGVYEVEWRGQKAYWTGYNPMPPVGTDNDGVDNIQTLLAEPLAAVGYHTKDAWMLERARGLLWYVCRELDVDGEWYYMSIDSAKYGLMHRSHMLAVVGPGLNAIAYLEAAGVDCSEIKAYFLRGTLLYHSWAAPSKWNFTYCLAKLLPEKPLPNDASSNGREVQFLDFVKVYHAELREVALKDTIPAGFAAPQRLRLAIDGPRGSRTQSVTPAELAEGVLLADDCRPGDAFEVRYTLKVQDITKVTAATKPQVILRGIEAMRGPEAWIEKTGEAGFVGEILKSNPINAHNFRDRGLYAGPLPR